jgi:histone deacetylase 1/2
MENANSTEYLEKIKNAVIENLKKTGTPSVQLQDVPRQSLGAMTDDDDAEMADLDADTNKDTRVTQRQWEQKVARDDEFEESDDEEMAEANGVYKTNGKRKGIMDYKNPHAPRDESRQPSPVVTRAASPVPAAADGTENVEGDETMEDVEPAPQAEAPGAEESEPAAAKEAEPEPAPPAAGAAIVQVDEDGDVDMAETTESAAAAPTSEAVEPTAPPSIKKEDEAEAQPSATTAEPTAEKAEPSEKAADEPAKTDEPAEAAAAEVAGAAKSPDAAAEAQEPAEKTASPAKPEEEKEDGVAEAKEASPKAERGDKDKPAEEADKKAEE